MAYKHIVLVFNKPILVNENTKITIEYEELFTHDHLEKVVQNSILAYVPSEQIIEGVPADRQCVVAFDNDYDMVVGDILVKYLYGITGTTGDTVMPFEKYFSPTYMPNICRLNHFTSMLLTGKALCTTNSIGNSTATNNSYAAIALSVIHYSGISTYVGVINP